MLLMGGDKYFVELVKERENWLEHHGYRIRIIGCTDKQWQGVVGGETVKTTTNVEGIYCKFWTWVIMIVTWYVHLLVLLLAVMSWKWLLLAYCVVQCAWCGLSCFLHFWPQFFCFGILCEPRRYGPHVSVSRLNCWFGIISLPMMVWSLNQDLTWKVD